jgi:hypothetical protein
MVYRARLRDLCKDIPCAELDVAKTHAHTPGIDPRAEPAELLQDNSFFRLAACMSSSRASPLCPDLRLLDHNRSLYLRLLEQMEALDEKVAVTMQRKCDVYNFCAQLTLAPPGSSLPIGSSMPLLCPVWHHQVTGQALQVGFRRRLNSERIDDIVVDLVLAHAAVHTRLYEQQPLMSMDPPVYPPNVYRSRFTPQELRDIALFALHGGVSASVTRHDGRCSRV